MNKEDRMKAFALRCDGFTWAQIAERLNYDETTVRDDLHTVLDKQKKCPRIIYPALAKYICQNHAGSIERFAISLQASPHRLRLVLVCGEFPSESLITKITTTTGMTREEAFAVGMDL
jgi:hypothetical protein